MDQGRPRANAPRIPEYRTRQYQQQDADTWQDQASPVANAPRIPEYRSSQYQQQLDAGTPQYRSSQYQQQLDAGTPRDQGIPMADVPPIREHYTSRQRRVPHTAQFADESSQDFSSSPQDQGIPIADVPPIPEYYTSRQRPAPNTAQSPNLWNQEFTASQQSPNLWSQDFQSPQQNQGRSVANVPRIPEYRTRRQQLAPYTTQNPGRSRQPNPFVAEQTNSLGRVSPYATQNVSRLSFPSAHTGSAGASASMPISSSSPGQLRGAGIQGGRNSTFMDATLFSMFAYTTIFDFYLNVDKGKSDTQKFSNICEYLRINIINPLRMNGYVDANTTQAFLSQIISEVLKRPPELAFGSMRAEEFVTLLLSQLFRCEPFLELSYNWNETTSFTLSLENNFMNFPSVQTLLDDYCKQHLMKFKKVPACLILVMPLAFDAIADHGKHVFKGILPNEKIYIQKYMTAIQEGKSYMLELVSAICNKGSSYWSYNRTTNGEWVQFNSKSNDKKHSLPGSSVQTEWISEVRHLPHLSEFLTEQSRALQRSNFVFGLYTCIRICFYVDSSRL